MANDPTPTAVEPAAEPVPGGRACENCGKPLLGDYCYQCGQPVKGLVRHFTSIMGDFLDSVFNIDARFPHTIWPLFAKPGFLSLEYFAGRRVRYVSPVRLFFFVSIITFFVAQLVIQTGNGAFQINDDGDGSRIGRATTVAEVEKTRDEAIAKLDEAITKAGKSPGATVGLRAAQGEIRTDAANRIRDLQAAAAKGEPPPPPTPATFSFDDGGNWDPKTNPVKVGWLPGFANDWLNAQIGRARENISRMGTDSSRYKDALLGAVPSTLFLLLPLFAVMLKIAYVFKRRLYMEHLIVALHSHAFLCLDLLLVFGVIALDRVVAPNTFADGMLRLLEVVLFGWMALYLLIMQKRVYRQGWFMTLVKYCALGFCYCILLSIGIAFTALLSLVWM
ncbi:DUF3667 domain-containing protein [Pseudoluteimonas lycopersici]|uniref:DUF3667 domain-containing protein n=1 Tax=Pseudoluteimonas lycopersici TaxID=1324796 RepID=A0A516V6U2_9GAMM|nr:DUF3667 domain-containing protein [Lysobacter lycopersici]QDQ74237.1 DUF3667 domain-containing protein [Lysobacter lycopersici]